MSTPLLRLLIHTYMIHGHVYIYWVKLLPRKTPRIFKTTKKHLFAEVLLFVFFHSELREG